MPPVARSVEELFPLIEFCKAGNLRAVSEWIAQKNPLDPPPGKKTRRATPLQIAIEKGFLTLTEMLLDGGADPMANGGALHFAVSHKRSDIAGLLLDRGCPVDSVYFPEVCYDADPDLIKLFLGRGADPQKGFPFYGAMIHCLRPMLGIYKTYVEKFPELETQANMALCHYAKEGNVRCVCLLMWAGAKPEVKLPEDKELAGDFAGDSAMAIAVRYGHLAVLKKMKPENFPELHVSMIEGCWLDEAKETLDYLLSFDIQLNLTGEKGAQLLEHVIWQLGWVSDPKPLLGLRSESRVVTAMERIEFLVKKGARWPQGPERGARQTRRHFRNVHPEKILQIFTLFKAHQVMEDAFMEELVGTPAMRAHLGIHAKKIHELFHPPPIKPAAKAPLPPEVAPPKPVLSVPQLKAKTEEFFWERIRNLHYFQFWPLEVHETLDTRDLRRFLDLEKNSEQPCFEFAQAAVEKINRKAKSFELSLEGNSLSQTIRWMTLRIMPGHDWAEVMKQAWSEVENPSPRFLGPRALQLLDWIQNFSKPEEWISDLSLAWKAGLRGRRRVAGGYLKELRQKLGKNLCYESQGHRYGEELKYRIWLEGEVSLETPPVAFEAPTALNPVMSFSLEHSTKKDFDAFRDLIHNHILSTRPTGTNAVFIFWIDNRKDLIRVFPNLKIDRFSPTDKILGFWEQVSLHPEIEADYDFSDDAEAWQLHLRPKTSWEAIIQSLEEQLAQPSLQKMHGLSDEAAKLLEWIENLRPENYEGSWTPIVEDEQEKKIGLTCPWDEENFSGYLQLLIEEINKKTPYDLSVQPWRSDSDWKTRIRVAKKESEETQLVRQLQFYGLQKGKFLDEGVVRATLSRLMES